MKTKTFDCVEMKRQGAKLVQERLKGMTIEERTSYWEGRNREFLAYHKKLCEQAKSS